MSDFVNLLLSVQLFVYDFNDVKGMTLSPPSGELSHRESLLRLGSPVGFPQGSVTKIILFKSFWEFEPFAIFAVGEFAPNEVRMFSKKGSSVLPLSYPWDAAGDP